MMAGERCRLTRNSFHHVAVAADRVDVVIKQFESWLIEIRSQPPSRHGHSHTVGYALSQWPGGSFDSAGHAVFRVAGSFAVNLAEFFEVVDGERHRVQNFIVGIDGSDLCKMYQRI